MPGYDFIGDVHGCIDELTALLTKMGYVVAGASMRHPEGRTAFFLGDLVNRGPDAVGVLKLVMAMVAAGDAEAVPGNHDDVTRRQLADGYEDPEGVVDGMQQIRAAGPEFEQRVIGFFTSLAPSRILDDGRLVAAHAGLPEALQGSEHQDARRFAIYGERPDRDRWAREYRGARKVVHGHVPVEDVLWVNGTVDIDTGCVYGGRLTALRYPELEVVAVPAARVYFEGRRTPELRAAAEAYRY
jgi:protein phosphatase